MLNTASQQKPKCKIKQIETAGDSTDLIVDAGLSLGLARGCVRVCYGFLF